MLPSEWEQQGSDCPCFVALKFREESLWLPPLDPAQGEQSLPELVVTVPPHQPVKCPQAHQASPGSTIPSPVGCCFSENTSLGVWANLYQQCFKQPFVPTWVSSSRPGGSEFCFWHDFGVSLGKPNFPCFGFYWGQLCHKELASRFGNGNKDGVVIDTGFLSGSMCIMFQAAFLISHIPVPLPHIRCPWHMSFLSALSN